MCYRKRRAFTSFLFDCFTWNIMRRFGLYILLAFALSACKSVAPCIPETITRDSVRVEYKLDSVYLYERDSIFVHEKRDTVFVERWKTRYKDAIKIQRDTVIDTKTEVQVLRVEVTPRFAKFCYWWFGISAFLIVAGAALWICKKFYVK